MGEPSEILLHSQQLNWEKFAFHIEKRGVDNQFPTFLKLYNLFYSGTVRRRNINKQGES